MWGSVCAFGVEEVLSGKTSHVGTPCGILHLTLNRVEDGEIVEVFAKLGRNRTCVRCMLGGMSAIIGKAIRYGVPVEEIGEELKGCGCGNTFWFGGKLYESCYDYIGKQILGDKDGKSE